MCPQSAPPAGIRTGRDGTERGTIRCEIKALAGNSATCLGFCFRLDAGSIPAASYRLEVYRKSGGADVGGGLRRDLMTGVKQRPLMKTWPFSSHSSASFVGYSTQQPPLRGRCLGPGHRPFASGVTCPGNGGGGSWLSPSRWEGSPMGGTGASLTACPRPVLLPSGAPESKALRFVT